MYRLVIALLLLSWSLPALAQLGGGERPEETIAKCLDDLASADAGKRRRAVLVLGKYNRPEVTEALLGALDDPEATVRRSALVALAERLPVHRLPRVLGCLGDPDVEVRRQAASLAHRLHTVYARAFGRTPGNFPLPERFTEELRETIAKAYGDDDPLVRQSLAGLYPWFRPILPEETIDALLRDDRREVRVAALEAAMAVLPRQRLFAAVAHLVNDPDRPLRLYLTRALAERRATRLLAKLAEDDDFEIASEAVAGLFLADDRGAWQELRPRLDDGRFPATLGERCIRQLLHHRQWGQEQALDLLRHDRASFRREALRVCLLGDANELPLAKLAACLEDSDSTVREMATAALSRRQDLGADMARRALESPHPDVRALALIISRRLETAPARNVVADLLLDDDARLRRLAIGEFAERRFAGWRKVLRQSLDDGAPGIARFSADLLLRDGSDVSLDALAAFVERCEDPRLAADLRDKLAIFRQLEASE